MKLNSIRWRLTLSYAAIALLAAFSLGLVLRTILRNYYDRQETSYLQNRAIEISSIASQLLEAGLPRQIIQDLTKSWSFILRARVQVLDVYGNQVADSGVPEAQEVFFIASERPFQAPLGESEVRPAIGPGTQIPLPNTGPFFQVQILNSETSGATSEQKDIIIFNGNAVGVALPVDASMNGLLAPGAGSSARRSGTPAPRSTEAMLPATWPVPFDMTLMLPWRFASAVPTSATLFTTDSLGTAVSIPGIITVEDDPNVRLVTLLRTSPNKFYRQGVEAADELVNGFPTEELELFRYDALMIGSFEAAALTPAQHDMIREFVSRRGGSLLMLGGRRGLTDGGWGPTSVAEVLPVRLPELDGPSFAREPARALLTAAGRTSAMTRLAADDEANETAWNGLPELADFQTLGGLKEQTSKIGGSTAAVTAAQSMHFNRHDGTAPIFSGTITTTTDGPRAVRS